ncbi:uncharacterized protein LOC106463311 [Limulus polyphemus]|uniref:Uncharacterized protein LOC106463311 n=1 Tax=Limulus polyphemus TaxID=6850 RepID=A0ABM1BBQ5_LIMPO|nr:uncharacterized protein LOC106463311 [Limulus polyphemus]XP_022246818.1 uncharacterized protein LOC106463311 [Limulus polyphemus]XP_022246824.1 uncharacterized protein LOC106463311 [Limulus polyphemus]XP_022246829.1 uncharacterized protein LOC106463311 [Limulus polyphemus]XP_022246834.1 uncharacterized protein LOC106463311 [Limulus polyphemus]XP_022246840.1 uncharacterized protein LOC106463311 [Limulus polyphemus]XP_022246846.1 uncharacterized protein LOC106463311 [Limulus polyphemus]
MANSDASAYLSVIQWGDKGYYLKEFTQNFTLPQAAKIIKGQYQNVGVPTLPCPSLNQIVFIASAGKKVRVGAQCVKFKDNRGVVPLGPKLAIPDNYDGWFEILSEDGRAVRCLENVTELARVLPETCLVRENVKGFLSKSEDPDSISDKTRTIAAGETLVLINELLMPLHKGKGSGRFLRCFTTRGETVYLSLEQKGKFSPIAGEDNISGVHSIKNLLSKRLPMMVRLVHGKPPPGFKSSFIPEMRLCSLLEEECVMVLPLLKDFSIVSLPINLPLKLQAPRNVESLIKLREYSRLSEKCKKMMQETSDRMQIIDPFLKKERVEGKLNCRYFHNHRHPKHIRNIPLIKRSFSDPMCQETAKTLVNLEPEVSAPGDNNDVQNGVTKPSDNRQVPDDRYDEIDQIYDYVRGFAPLPSKVKTELKTKDNSSLETPNTTKCTDFTIHPTPAPQSLSQKDTDDVAEEKEKPEPPPIETIPVRKLSMCAESTQTTAQKITVSIVNKSSSKLKDDTVVSKDVHPEEHIYEKVEQKNDERKSANTLIHHPRAPIRSNSAGKVYIASGNHSTYNNKLFFKSPSQQKYIHKNRFLKHNKTSPSKDTAMPIQRTSRAKSYRNSKALTTSSPLFHIRYKSLTNLVAEFNNTLDSSNSGGQTSSGSAGSKEKDSKPRNRKLPRPKSMTNLFWDVHHLDSCNKYNLIQNEINNKIENRKFIFAHETSTPKLIHATQNKRIGTLYL